MDPIAHTLVGAALAQSGLRDKTRYATAALLIGANLPDVDGASMFLGTESLCWRRGWTHGVLAMAVLPAVLTGALLLIDRLRRSTVCPPNAAALLALSYLAFLTHPFLDWLNNYGVRLLMPFDGRWFYGDALFIVDPWMWLILGGSAFLFYSKRAASLAGWLVGASLAGALFWLAGPPELLGAKVAWTTALAILLVLRTKWRFPAVWAARLALTLVTIYIGLMVISTRYARTWVTGELVSRGIVAERLMVGPLPVSPFTRDVVAETASGYRYGQLKLLPSPTLILAERVLPKMDQPLHSPESHCFMNWARFPFAEVVGDAVWVMDARYTREKVPGFGALVLRR